MDVQIHEFKRRQAPIANAIPTGRLYGMEIDGLADAVLSRSMDVTRLRSKRRRDWRDRRPDNAHGSASSPPTDVVP